MIIIYALILYSLGITFIFLGIKATIKMFFTEEIIKFPFSQKEAEFSISNPGYYSIYLHSVFIKKYPVRWYAKVKNSNSLKEIRVNRVLFVLRTSSIDGHKSEQFDFKIDKPDTYLIQIEDNSRNNLIDKLDLKISSENNKFVSVRKGVSTFQKIILFPQIILFFIGLLGIIFGTIYLYDPKAFR